MSTVNTKGPAPLQRSVSFAEPNQEKSLSDFFQKWHRGEDKADELKSLAERRDLPFHYQLLNFGVFDQSPRAPLEKVAGAVDALCANNFFYHAADLASAHEAKEILLPNVMRKIEVSIATKIEERNFYKHNGEEGAFCSSLDDLLFDENMGKIPSNADPVERDFALAKIILELKKRGESDKAKALSAQLSCNRTSEANVFTYLKDRYQIPKVIKNFVGYLEYESSNNVSTHLGNYVEQLCTRGQFDRAKELVDLCPEENTKRTLINSIFKGYLKHDRLEDAYECMKSHMSDLPLDLRCRLIKGLITSREDTKAEELLGLLSEFDNTKLSLLDARAMALLDRDDFEIVVEEAKSSTEPQIKARLLFRCIEGYVDKSNSESSIERKDAWVEKALSILEEISINEFPKEYAMGLRCILAAYIDSGRDSLALSIFKHSDAMALDKLSKEVFSKLMQVLEKFVEANLNTNHNDPVSIYRFIKSIPDSKSQYMLASHAVRVVSSKGEFNDALEILYKFQSHLDLLSNIPVLNNDQNQDPYQYKKLIDLHLEKASSNTKDAMKSVDDAIAVVDFVKDHEAKRTLALDIIDFCALHEMYQKAFKVCDTFTNPSTIKYTGQIHPIYAKRIELVKTMLLRGHS